MSSFGLGYVPDPVLIGGRLATSARPMLGTEIAPLHALGFAERLPNAWDQGPASACLGFGWGLNLGLLLGWFPSPASIYTNARCIDRDDPTWALTDVGSYPWAAARAIEEFGVARLEAWPFSLSRINAEPTLNELLACNPFRTFRPRKIYSSGLDLADDIARAVANGFPVSFGMTVRQSYLDYSGDVLDWQSGDAKGGHWQTVWGYETLATGRRVFHVRNSWGAGWGEDGDARVSDAFVANYVTDPYLAQVAA